LGKPEWTSYIFNKRNATSNSTSPFELDLDLNTKDG